ncbi:MAG: beta-ketoacyl-ACP synthase II [Firmicutes bacterium]|nr:beta-ketoacyl-ACP synthase II [Bacillota bacterium]
MQRVAITGIGVISPVGNGKDAFWRNLCAGRSGIGLLDRFDTQDFKVKVAAQVRDFSPADYGMDVPSARKMDLYCQYAMAAATLAMEDGALAGTVEPERFGVYVGSGIGGMQTFIQETEKLLDRGPGRVSPFFIPMMIGNIAAGNIAIAFNAQGPCLPTVTACATSSHAIGEAYRAVAQGYADAILAGGAEATINPLAVAGFTSCQALSLSQDPETASLPFDARRDGFVMGEGAAVLILESYAHAKARGAHIYAEIAGYSNTCDAYHVTAPRPDGSCAARAIAMAAREAGWQPDQLLYINAHGTGTPLNDKAETAAIKLALGEEQARKAWISSSKSMTGHMLGAAGATEAAVCALALKDGIAPPTIHYRQPDPACDLDYVPNQARRGPIALALSLSLGFGGHNACLALRPMEENA